MYSGELGEDRVCGLLRPFCFLCVCSGRSQGDRKSRSLCPQLQGWGHQPPPTRSQMNLPPLGLLRNKSKLSKKGRAGQESGATVRPQLSSSGRPTRKPRRGRWTALAHRALHARPEPRLGLPTPDTRASPGPGRGCGYPNTEGP